MSPRVAVCSSFRLIVSLLFCFVFFYFFWSAALRFQSRPTESSSSATTRPSGGRWLDRRDAIIRSCPSPHAGSFVVSTDFLPSFHLFPIIFFLFFITQSGGRFRMTKKCRMTKNVRLFLRAPPIVSSISISFPSVPDPRLAKKNK